MLTDENVEGVLRAAFHEAADPIAARTVEAGPIVSAVRREARGARVAGAAVASLAGCLAFVAGALGLSHGAYSRPGHAPVAQRPSGSASTVIHTSLVGFSGVSISAPSGVTVSDPSCLPSGLSDRFGDSDRSSLRRAMSPAGRRQPGTGPCLTPVFSVGVQATLPHGGNWVKIGAGEGYLVKLSDGHFELYGSVRITLNYSAGIRISGDQQGSRPPGDRTGAVLGLAIGSSGVTQEELVSAVASLTMKGAEIALCPAQGCP